ncbi:uncharacterized protein LOC134194381 isoform X2 [Corticium candelabrum]|uniref:uncharacterized protein LOC134194381 isoform X2 n=1 Tax=Corticium candelabrum TaxID=121492 RepID=UPI002E253F05|nr:uncharacterized protein LOC134194381 isoform X2 [Corticium candelabrum]
MSCHRCDELQKELNKCRANFRVLNEKIVSTELLIKKYKEKCLQLEEVRKQAQEKAKSLEAAQKAVHTLRGQLEEAMMRAVSPAMDSLQLKAERDRAVRELEAAKVEADSQLMLVVQLKAHIAEKKEKLKQMELEKELKQEEIAQVKSSAKLLGEQMDKLKKQKSEEKNVAKQLTASKRKEQTLQKQLTAAKEEIKQLKSEISSRKHAMKLNGHNSLEIFSPTKVKVRRTSAKECKMKGKQQEMSLSNRINCNGFNTHCLSPLPPSPQKTVQKQRTPKKSSHHSPQDQSASSGSSHQCDSLDRSEGLGSFVKEKDNDNCQDAIDRTAELRADDFVPCGLHEILSFSTCSEDSQEESDLQVKETSESVRDKARDDCFSESDLFGCDLSELSESEDEMESETVSKDEPLSSELAANGNGEVSCGDLMQGNEVQSCESKDTSIDDNMVTCESLNDGNSTPINVTDFVELQSHKVECEHHKVECEQDKHFGVAWKHTTISVASTEIGECIPNTSTTQQMKVGCDILSRQSVCQHPEVVDERDFPLNKSDTLCQSDVTKSGSSSFDNTISQTQSLDASYLCNKIGQNPTLLSPHVSFSSESSIQPTIDSSQRNSSIRSAITLERTAKLWQLLCNLEAKSNLLPLPFSSSQSLFSPSNLSLKESQESSQLSSMSIRSQQMDQVVYSLRSCGSKRKLLFSSPQDLCDEDKSLCSFPKRFSSALPNSDFVVKPKPIRQTRPTAVSINSDISTNETSLVHVVSPALTTQAIAGKLFCKTAFDTCSIQVDGSCSDQTSIAAKSDEDVDIEGEMEEGELVDETVDVRQEESSMTTMIAVDKKRDTGKSACTQETKVNNRPSSQSEDSYITKGLQRLRRQSCNIDELARSFALPENISAAAPLAQAIVKSLSQRKDDVGKQIRRVCAEVRRNPCAEFAPVLSLYEKRLLNLVSLIQTVQSQQGLVEMLLRLLPRQLSEIKENKWNTAFSCGLRAACVCRFFASLCRQEGNAERLRIFCFDLYREFAPFTVKELLCIEAISVVWPQVVRKQPSVCLYREGHVYLDAVHPQLTYSVMEALLLTQFKCSTNIQSKVLESIYLLLHWSRVPSGCVVVHELSLTITKFLCHSVAVDVSLKGGCPVLNPVAFELVKCFELLSVWMGTAWTDGFLIRQLLWPIIKDWLASTSSDAQNPGQKKQCWDTPIATTCRFLGCVGRVVCSNDDSLDRLVSILSSVLAQIPVEAGGVGLVQLCAAWSLTDLSRWRPREVQSAVKQWISAVPASGSDSLCSALRQRMLSIT